MYIKSIDIEGFKSYASRVQLNNFDPAFNAITGLNGSGKSNILDSICFVLGIKNLSQVPKTMTVSIPKSRPNAKLPDLVNPSLTAGPCCKLARACL